MKRIFTASLVIILSLATIGCETPMRFSKKSNRSISRSSLLVKAPPSVWDRMVDSYHLEHFHHDVARVQYYIEHYAKHSHHITGVTKKARPYIYHVLSVLEEYNMPSELALLPMIESSYHPQATSHMGASGIWQLAALTGKYYGLKQDHYYDGRHDIDAATRAALGHLKFLHEKFDGDWLLALAAYNAGGARVAKAIKLNQQLGKPTDYWSLPLPKETQNYVPKFLALAHVMKNSKQYEIPITHVDDTPYFFFVDIGTQIDLNVAAELAELEIKELKRLNPAYRLQITHPHGPHTIALPITHADVFEKNLAALNDMRTLIGKDTYTVASGDSLSLIARKHQVTVQYLKEKNDLKSDTILVGQKLVL